MSKFAISLSALILTAGVLPVMAEVPASSITIAQTSAEKAPIGNYTATLGTTTISRTAATSTTARRVRSNAPSTQGVLVSINLKSYSSQEELNAISKAGVSSLVNYNHGTVTIAGRSQPINLAISSRRGNSHVVLILSARPYGAIAPQGGSISGSTYGAIRLVIPITDGATGTGTMFTMVGSRISNFGDEILSGGATATTTPLSAVKLN